ncbi:MAG TPA: EAL domain-containing protein, partial [bacterium]|nr:EAL domain-containing protein [bacterium]
METLNVSILHISASPEDSEWLEQVLLHESPSALSLGFERDSRCRILTVSDIHQAKPLFLEEGVDVVLLESSGSDEQDTSVLSQIRTMAPETPVIVLSPEFRSESLAHLLGQGAQDYLVKRETTGDRVGQAIRSAFERQRFQNQSRKVLGETGRNFNVLMDMSLDGVAVFQRGIIKAANPAFDRILGYDRGETQGKPISCLCRPEYQSYFKSQIERGVDTPIVIAAKKKDLSPLYLEYRVRPCTYNGEPAFVIDIHDITERRKSEEALRHRAYWDLVTELPNRYLFFDRLKSALDEAGQTGGKVALFYIDLDRFKMINDTLGHATGDQLLRAVSRRLSHAVRREDTVARLGGDEFSVILRDSQELEDIPGIARKILGSLLSPIHVQKNELHVSASIGISLFPDDAPTAEKLVQRADVAMYHAKEKGRNAFCLYQDAMDAGGVDKLDLQNSLYRAVEKEEFYLLYQPQVDMESGKVVGLEALLRWDHPVRGPISPTEFIPLTEETGLIILLGQWVLKKACAQNKAWQNMGLPPVRMAVNLSAVQFIKHTLPFLIDKTLKETGLDPKYLELEITEGIAMRDPAFTLATLREMTEIFKLRIALDDFGMAYSSLGYLKHFPLHCLKIDKSFISGIGRGTKDDAIVRSILVLAQNMGMEVVAEGVETEEQ